MPIRTNRGRAAIYRRLWSWPMRSPSHLVGTIILFVAIIAAAGIVVPRLVSDGQASGSTPPTSESGSAQAGEPGTSNGAGDSGGSGDSGAPPVTRLTEPRETPSQAPAAPQALRVAEQWAAAWVEHDDDTTVDAWLDGLRPYTTAEFLPVMRSVDPANIPATTVEGTAEAGDSYPRSVEALISTDGPDLSVTVIKTDEGWRVSDYSRVG
ncbi:hypothetical protein GCM10009676_34550 [Prauserella halophila]|uniref:Mce-associated membrane protein n=1 Tax=Prauserella halophila TaxID=185641 RepID=A0ABP4H0E6_9PSEU|nr:hypothetical protein [Prauserella halophila]MCP2238431.1 hypothetical protein [Prauserella halophila]